MNIRIPDYAPSPKQATFHQSPCFETFFAGAAGPGKTAALCAEAITSCLEKPKTNAYLFRRTLSEIILSIHAEIEKQLAPYNNNTKYKIIYNGSSSRWTFPNGSFIQYAYCQYDGDVYRYQSAEIHFLGIDELTHFKEEWYDYLKTRVRSTGGHRLRVMAASNPGNIGHGWCKKYFVDLGDQVIHTDKLGRKRQYIKATIDDHPDKSFREQYKIALGSIKNERLRKALRWGDWNAFEGQVFMEWDEKDHVIDKLPEGVLEASFKYVGYDVGRRDPGCAIWVLKAPENEYGVEHYYAYREIYQQWRDGRQWANDIKYFINDEPIEFVVLPHDAFAIGHGASRSFADIFSEEDIPYERANSLTRGSRMHRQDLLHQLLQISPDGTPYLQIHKDCQNLIRTIPDLPYSETIREQIDDKAEDHCLVGETPVLTADGWKRIDELDGARITGYNSKVIKLITEDDKELICTPNHKIMTPKGWIEAQDLKQDSEILWSLLNEDNLITANPITYAVSTFNEKANGYIERSGKTITKKKSLKAFISTIRTQIERIILLKTWNVSPNTFTSQVILPHQPKLNVRLEGLMRSVRADGVTLDLLQNNVVKRLKKVTSDGYRDKVYDISIYTAAHAFIANGFVVHNSYDALTYALMVIDDPESWLVSPKFKEPEFPVTPTYGEPGGVIHTGGIDVGKILQGKEDRDWRSM